MYVDTVSEPFASEKEAMQEIVPDLSRRKTLVAPPSLEQVQQELESAGEGIKQNQ